MLIVFQNCETIILPESRDVMHCKKRQNNGPVKRQVFAFNFCQVLRP